MLRKNQRIAELLLDRLDPTLTPQELRQNWSRVRTEVTTAWQTEDHPRERLTVADEREHVVFYLAEILYRIVPAFYDEIAEALAKLYGVQPESLELPNMLRFGTWVGGDMDGNPDVHAKTIRETLARQQQVIINAYFSECQMLAQLLSQSASRSAVTPELQPAHRAIRHADPRRARHHAHAPRSHAVPRVPRPDRRAAARHLRPPAQRLRRSAAVPARSQAHRRQPQGQQGLPRRLGQRAAPDPARRDLRLSPGDARPAPARGGASPRHRRRVSTIRTGWRARRPSATTCWCRRSSATPACKVELDALGKRTLGVFEAILQARHRYGPDAIGYYVVSGTQGADDVLAPLLLARWAEAYDRNSGEVAVDIAPLFESVEALEHCGDVMRTLLGDPLYRRHLEARGRTQCALIGYSDTNKESGICASRFAAYRAQAELSAALAAANERHVIFHARGGSIARGGGRIDSLVRTAPAGTVNGVLRLTEQGEVINQGYGLRPIAMRTLERAFNALVLSLGGAATRRQRRAPSSCSSRRAWRP